MRLPEDFSGATNDSHLVELWLAGRPKSTQAVYRREALAFLRTLAERKVDGIRNATVADIVVWVEALSGADTTRARVIATVKSLLTYAHRTGYTVFNIGRALRCPKIPSNLHKRIVEEDTIHEVLKAAKTPRDKAITRLFYISGIRSGELCGLTFADIKGTRITVLGKGMKSRTLLLPPDLVTLLLKLRQKGDSDSTPVFRSVYGRAFTPITMWKLITTISDEAGFKLSPHWFRHAHASHSLDNGAPVQVLQYSLGHANLATTSKYVHVKPNQGTSQFIRV